MRRPNKDRKIKIGFCACGCGKTLNLFDERNRPRKYLLNHFLRIKGQRKGRFEKEMTPWNKGKKDVMPIPWNKGKKLPFYPHIKAIGRKSWNKGKHLFEETKKKISEANKGKISWNKGLKYTKERKEKMNIDGLKFGRLGNNKFSLETRKKMSESHKGKKLSKEVIRKCLRRRNMSGLEKKTLLIIDKYKLPYKFVGNGKFFIENINPDFVNTNGEKKILEVYWERHKEQFRNGGVNKWMADRKDICAKYGWEVMFLEGAEINEKRVLEILLNGGGYHR